MKALAAVWRWRTEIAVFAGLLISHQLLTRTVGGGRATDLAWLAGIAILVGAPQSRTVLTRWLHAARVRRAWTRAVIDSGAADPPPKHSRRPASLYGPRATRVTPTPSGENVRVKIGRGETVQALEKHADQIAACLKVMDVRIHPDPRNAARATAQIVRRDIFHDAEPFPWQNLDADTLSVWDPVPFGIHDDGQPVTIPEMGTGHILMGGVTGSGKSVALQILVAQTALDPTAHLILFDNQKVELAMWASCARASIDRNIRDGVRVLQGVQTVMQTRTDRLYQDLVNPDREDAKRKVGPGDETYTVFIDELAFYLTHPDKEQRDAFTGVLLDLLQRGRKAGIRVVACMQRPSAELLPTDLRAQFSVRVAFRVMEAETTQMILGTREAEAHNIPDNGYAGVGYIAGESTRPRRFRTPYLTEDDIRTIAARASNLRAGLEVDALVPEPEPAKPKKRYVEERDAGNKQALLDHIPSMGEGLTRSEITEAVGKPDRELYPVLQALLKDGAVERAGGGRKGDPYRYRTVRDPVPQETRSSDTASNGGE